VRSIGYEVAATPDGRHVHEAIAANMSPAPGSDRSGPIAAICSSVKMRPCDLAGGAPLDLRLSKSTLRGQEGTQRLAALIQGFIGLGGNMLTLTVTDVEELKRAMAEPEKYRHLRVRMGGWSAYFCMLSEEQQLLQIRRGEQGLI
jgi:formate C-acetyltransferase